MSKEYDEYVEYVRLAKEGALHAGFDQWELANKEGYTVAHVAAWGGHLPVLGPADFDRWDLADRDGWTVAHSMVTERELPETFNQWTLANKDGWAVAHVAAQWGHLPKNFDQWGLINNAGMTVLSCLFLSDQSGEYISRWRKERPLCRESADWEVFKKELPEIYRKYAVNECMFDTNSEPRALLL
jgi:hypothetical protein